MPATAPDCREVGRSNGDHPSAVASRPAAAARLGDAEAGTTLGIQPRRVATRRPTCLRARPRRQVLEHLRQLVGVRASPSRGARRRAGRAFRRWVVRIAIASSWASSMRRRTSASMQRRDLVGVVRLVAVVAAEEDLAVLLAELAARVASLMPYSVTIARAISVAFSMSFAAPVVGSRKTSSSAVRPPSSMASSSRSWAGVEVPVLSGSDQVQPSARPRRDDRHLVDGSAFGSTCPTSAWPPSW